MEKNIERQSLEKQLLFLEGKQIEVEQEYEELLKDDSDFSILKKLISEKIELESKFALSDYYKRCIQQTGKLTIKSFLFSYPICFMILFLLFPTSLITVLMSSLVGDLIGSGIIFLKNIIGYFSKLKKLNLKQATKELEKLEISLKECYNNIDKTKEKLEIKATECRELKAEIWELRRQLNGNNPIDVFSGISIDTVEIPVENQEKRLTLEKK